MAVNAQKGETIGVYVNNGTISVPVWELVVCSTSSGFSGTTGEIDSSSKCDGDNEAPLPGKTGWSFSEEGFYNSAPDTGSISNDGLFELWNTRAVMQWKLANADDSYLRIGMGFINQLDETGADGEYITYNIGIRGTGAVSNVETT